MGMCNNTLGCNNNSQNSNQCGCNNQNNLCTCNGSTTNVNTQNVTSNNLKETLTNFIGRRCTCEFCICGNTVRKTGILSCVGCNFLTLASINNGNCLLCDTTCLNFVTINN